MCDTQIMQPKVWGSMDLWNVGILPWHYTASHPRRLWPETSLLWKPQNSQNEKWFLWLNVTLTEDFVIRAKIHTSVLNTVWIFVLSNLNLHLHSEVGNMVHSYIWLAVWCHLFVSRPTPHKHCSRYSVMKQQKRQAIPSPVLVFTGVN
jgi:hypothetical protein